MKMFFLFLLILILAFLQISLFSRLPFGIENLNLLLVALIVITAFNSSLGLALALFAGFVLEYYSSKPVFLTLVSLLVPIFFVVLLKKFFPSLRPGCLPSFLFVVPTGFMAIIISNFFIFGLLMPFFLKEIFFELIWSLAIFSFLWIIHSLFRKKKILQVS